MPCAFRFWIKLRPASFHTVALTWKVAALAVLNVTGLVEHQQ
jgi:hypothetical protein